MRPWSRWIGAGAAVGIITALVPVVRGKIALPTPLARLERRVATSGTASHAARREGPDFSGLDLMRLELHPRRVTAPLSGGRVAELTLDPYLEREALAVMKRYRIPEAGTVVMQVKTGKILAWASYVNTGKPFDVNVRAEAPAASTFKIVTASALVEKAGLNAETKQCYHGGHSRILASELKDDPRRDKWCATLAMALGRSLNVVFAKLAKKHLTPEEETAMGGAYGYGAPVPFAVPNEAPKIDMPIEPVEFARAAAGFWHTSNSPLGEVSVAQTVANDGVALAPRIVRAIYKGQKKIWQDNEGPRVLRRAVKPSTAHEVQKMMLQTVANGTAYKSFHDRHGRPYIPNVAIAGKTGTLTRHKENRLYTWFIGYAPAGDPQVAIASLVVNTPIWRIKAPELARQVLQAYFASKGTPGVAAP